VTRSQTDVPRGYRIISALARTPSSDVYLVRRGRERLVLKVLATSAGPEEREMFRVGVTIMQRLRHPNVIEVIDAGELLDRRPWMAMVYLEAGSLQQHVDPTSALPADEVVFTGIRVAEVLAMLHAERLVHRDVKPANILRAADGEHGSDHLPDATGRHRQRAAGTAQAAAPAEAQEAVVVAETVS